MEENKVLLSVKDLSVKFRVRGRILTAIRNISLDIYENESIAIVGESGSGKSVFTKTFAGMLDSNGFIPEGSIILSDDELSWTNVKLSGLNRTIYNRAYNTLCEYSKLERGAKEYREILVKEDEIRHAKSLTVKEEEEFAARLKKAKDDMVDTGNYLMTLDRKVDNEEYVKGDAKIRRLKQQIEEIEREKQEVIRKRVEAYQQDTGRFAADQKLVADLKAQREKKIAVPENANNPFGLDNEKLERNRILAYEYALSIGRFPVRSRLRGVPKLNKAFREAMSKGENLNDPLVRNKLFECIGYRVEYRSTDIGASLTLDPNGSYRFASEEARVEDNGHWTWMGGMLTLVSNNGSKECGTAKMDPHDEEKSPLKLRYTYAKDARFVGDYVIPLDTIEKLQNGGEKVTFPTTDPDTLHGYAIIDCAKVRNPKDWTKIRGYRIATVFQDPMTSLNPIITIGKQITSVILRHQNCSEIEARDRAVELMYKVGIPNPEKRFDDYPFQYSGGMRQRIVIAIALSCQPKILICDEPTTALDVTIQAQILKLLKDLQKEYNYTIVFITHDLGVVANVADRVAVLYAGQIVELGTVEEVFYDPRHPYTWALLSSLPQLAERNTKLFSITGTPPSLYNKIVGDAFAPRNQYCMKIDTLEEPPMFQVSETHFAKTWLLDPRAPKTDKPELINNIHEKLMNAMNI